MPLTTTLLCHATTDMQTVNPKKTFHTQPLKPNHTLSQTLTIAPVRHQNSPKSSPMSDDAPICPASSGTGPAAPAAAAAATAGSPPRSATCDVEQREKPTHHKAHCATLQGMCCCCCIRGTQLDLHTLFQTQHITLFICFFAMHVTHLYHHTHQLCRLSLPQAHIQVSQLWPSLFE